MGGNVNQHICNFFPISCAAISIIVRFVKIRFAFICSNLWQLKSVTNHKYVTLNDPIVQKPQEHFIIIGCYTSLDAI